MMVKSTMFSFPQSIRQKITLGSYAIIVLIVGLSLFMFIELRLVEKRIMFGETISDFFDTTLEIRRFEKNYFLYAKGPDYEENITYVTRAQEILEESIPGFSTIASAEQIQTLRDNLGSYKALMEQYSGAKSKGLHLVVLEESIRKKGKDIITAAEAISKSERKNLQALLARHQGILVLSIAALSVLAIIIGQVLSRIVVRPLKSLEESMGVIAEGKFERVSINSKDREIVSLTKAFNKMLRELELHERHLIQSEKLASLGTLLSGVAHELNNPLSNISSSNQILTEELKECLGSWVAGPGTGKREQESKDKRPSASPPVNPHFVMELVAQINDQTDRARNIVRSLLDFSRDREFKKETLSLRKLFDETIQFIRGDIPTNITVTLDVPDDISVFVDKQRIQQAFLNLIKNAVDATAPKEGRISIIAHRQLAIEDTEDDRIGIYNYLKYRGECPFEEDTVDIEIQDTGSGIPIEIIPKIFDPFFTTKEVGKGSGLGLFIVHEIVKEHDGCIAVDSEPGKGTSFLIRLPMKES